VPCKLALVPTIVRTSGFFMAAALISAIATPALAEMSVEKQIETRQGA